MLPDNWESSICGLMLCRFSPYACFANQSANLFATGALFKKIPRQTGLQKVERCWTIIGTRVSLLATSMEKPAILAFCSLAKTNHSRFLGWTFPFVQCQRETTSQYMRIPCCRLELGVCKNASCLRDSYSLEKIRCFGNAELAANEKVLLLFPSRHLCTEGYFME